MSKIHPVYRLIHSLESSEKSYFKRYGFKKESKNNDSLKRLFDLVDKQAEFDLTKILRDGKLNDNVKAHIHVNLNYLHKRIVQSILDSRRESDKLSIVFSAIEEFNLYKEKKLFSLANRTLKSIDKLVQDNDFFLLKPSISNLSVELNRMEVGRDYKLTEKLISAYEESIQDFSAMTITHVVGLKIEGLMDRNGGPMLKCEEDKQLARELILKTNGVIALNKPDVQLRSVSTNNLYILTLMVGKWQDFEQISSSLIDFYKKNMESKTRPEEMYDFLAVLINLCYFNLSLADKSYQKSLEILKRDQHLLHEGETKKNLILQVHTLHLLKVALYEAQEIDQSELLEFAQIFKDVPTNSLEGMAYRRQIALILYKRGAYKMVLDETSEVMQFEIKGIYSNGMTVTRMIRVMAWLKLENLAMFEAELNQVYRFVLEMDKDKLIRRIVNYIKRLGGNPSKQKKAAELNKLQEDYNSLLEANEMSEYLALKVYMDLIFFEAN